ncbi:hypothetical protein [Sphingobium sp.]|uniref:hypothetical protein n=1 Tax=Sphingobium sp. TaxID=1912891 RepID=UPI002C22488E|nr:hypothetical protein [Sphingobium sp.]HUD94180.1 hypothetical protein [Sphingobium sp.]
MAHDVGRGRQTRSPASQDPTLPQEWHIAAEQVMRYAPYQIRSSDLEDEWIKAKLARPIPCRAEDDNQESLFSDMAQSAPSCDFGQVGERFGNVAFGIDDGNHRRGQFAPS